MKKECQDYLALRTKPGLSGTREASWILGVNEDWISVLVAGGVLRPAGGHEPGCQYYFHTGTLIRLAEDPDWADKALKAVRKSFARKNAGGAGE